MRDPWTIIKRVRLQAFKLDLKENRGQKHNVFPVGLLEPYHESTIPGRVEPPLPHNDDENDVYNLEDVLDSKVEHRVVK